MRRKGGGREGGEKEREIVRREKGESKKRERVRREKGERGKGGGKGVS